MYPLLLSTSNVPDLSDSNADAAYAPFAELGETPLVTVVTPSFNQGSFISETIESVLEQDYPRIEYLVIDGGSTDNTLNVLHNYDGRLDWVSEPDRNQSNAINKGFRRARGEIICWVNSDDLLAPGAITRVVAEFKQDPSVGLVYGATRLIDREGKLIEVQASRPPDLWMMVFLADHLAQPSTFMRREAYAEVGEIDESLRYSMDYELFIRFFAIAPARQVPDVLSDTRIHAETFTASGGTARYREVVRVVRHHSGKRIPPAALFYAIDWYELGARRLLRAFGRQSMLQRLANTFAKHGYHLVIRFFALFRHSPWEDGWNGRSSTFLVREREGDFLEIAGYVPGTNGADRSQRLTINVDGLFVDRVNLPVGPFRLAYPLPRRQLKRGVALNLGGRAIDMLCVVKVRAKWSERAFRFDKHAGKLKDRRRLSWQLKSIRAISESDASEPQPIGWFEDGWASPSVTIFVPASVTELRISGRLPEESALRGQRLVISLNDVCVHDGWLTRGKFDFTISKPRSMSSRAVALHLDATKWFVASEEAHNGGPRKLAYLLDVAENVEVHALGADRSLNR